MSNRYIHRYFLPQRQYVAGAPVILAAGALLEDTKLPRLVVQLKFENISPKTISSLRVNIRCFAEDGGATKGVGFLYKSLSIRRGQLFGQYTAIVLPETDAYSFSAEIKYVDFHDGTRWASKQGDGSSALRDAKQKNRPLASPDAPLAQPPALRATPFVREGGLGDTTARPPAEPDIPKKPAVTVSGSTPLVQPPPSADGTPFVREGGLGDTTARPPAEPAPSPPSAQPPVGTTAPGRPPPVKRRKTKWIAIAGAGAAVIIAAVLLLPQMIGHDSSFSGNPSPAGISNTPDRSGNRPSANADATATDAQDKPGGFSLRPGNENNNEPVILEPTLPAPTNVHWGYDSQWQGQIWLLWDWEPPPGESADDYRFTIDYSFNDSQWQRADNWGAIQNRTIALQALIASDNVISGEYRFRITTRKIGSQEISEPAEIAQPLILTVLSESITITEAIFGFAPAEIYDEFGDIILVRGDGLDAAGMTTFISMKQGERIIVSGGGGSGTLGEINERIRNIDRDQPISTAQVWLLTDQDLSDDGLSMTVRGSNRIPVLTEADGVNIPREPQVSNIRFARDDAGILSFAFDIPPELNGDNNSIPFIVEYRRDGGEFESYEAWVWDENLRLHFLSEAGTYSDFRITTRSQSRHPLRNSLPVLFDGAVTVQESGEPLPLSTEDLTAWVEGQVFMASVTGDLRRFSSGKATIISMYSDSSNPNQPVMPNWNWSHPNNQRTSFGATNINRVPGTTRVTMQTYESTIEGNFATVIVTPKQNPPIAVPEPAP